MKAKKILIKAIVFRYIVFLFPKISFLNSLWGHFTSTALYFKIATAFETTALLRAVAHGWTIYYQLFGVPALAVLAAITLYNRVLNTPRFANFLLFFRRGKASSVRRVYLRVIDPDRHEYVVPIQRDTAKDFGADLRVTYDPDSDRIRAYGSGGERKLIDSELISIHDYRFQRLVYDDHMAKLKKSF